MEYLSRLLEQLETTKSIHFHPKCGRLKLIQLSFADDLLLFYRGEVSSVKHLFNQFQEFSKASGLIANLSKSSVYCGGVTNEIQEAILAVLGFSGVLPIRYLGVPLSTKRVSVV